MLTNNLKIYFDQTLVIVNKNKYKYLIFILFSLVFIVLTFNLINYDHELGYDAAAHKWYVEVLPFALPTDQDTYEFFSPPLPYIFPSLIDSVCDKLVELNFLSLDCTFLYGKFTQALQAILFIFILFFYINISEQIFDNNNEFLISLLTLLVIISANYKTFAMIRGEPYVTFFVSWSIYLLFKLIKNNFIYDKKFLYYVGFIFGLLALSRQWGFLFFLSLGFYFIYKYRFLDKDVFLRFFKAMFVMFLIAFLMSGWFYFNLYFTYGSFTTFNEIPQSLEIENNPYTFYITTGFQDYLLFKEPFRGSSMNKGIFPILHSDMWGDWWGYFLIRTGREGEELNISQILPYLGRVNLVSLFPALIYISGIIFSFKIFSKKYRKYDSTVKEFYLFSNFVLIIGWLGFLWFNIKYPEEKGDTVKATYIIYLLNVLPFYGALIMDRINKFDPRLFKAFLSILFIILAHNIPAMMTRF